MTRERFVLIRGDEADRIQRDFPGVALTVVTELWATPGLFTRAAGKRYDVRPGRDGTSYVEVIIALGAAVDWSTAPQVAERIRPHLHNPAKRLTDSVRMAMDRDSRFERSWTGARWRAREVEP